MEKNYYMVRIQNNQFDIAEQKNAVAVGWSDWNLSQMTEQEIEQQIGKACDEWCFAPQLRGKKINEIKRFKGIKKGDYILVPHWNNVWLAIADDEFIYDEKSKNCDLANQLKVKFLKDKNGNNRCVARNQLSERLSRRLHLRGATVLELYDFKDEIEKIFNDDAYSVSKSAAEHEYQLTNTFKHKLLENICNGDVYLKSGGIGLEELVCELFECDKFEAHILSKRAFKSYGDADVEATSKFISVLAQVKHHNGNTGIWGIEQLKEIKKNGEDKGYDKLMLITSGTVNDNVQQEAEKYGIMFMDGEQLVDWIYENLNDLSAETKARLKISIAPIIIG